MFFLIPKNVKREKPIPRMPTAYANVDALCEALRASDVVKWQLKYSVDWDATDGQNGGAQQTVYKTDGKGEV